MVLSGKATRRPSGMRNAECGMRDVCGDVLKLNEILFEIILVQRGELWYNIAKNFCGRGTYE